MRATDFSSCADNKMPYVTAETLDDIVKTLEKYSTILFQWFLDNQFTANIGKCYLIVIEKNKVTMRVGDTEISPLSVNPTKWSNTLKQFVSCCRRIGCI